MALMLRVHREEAVQPVLVALVVVVAMMAVARLAAAAAVPETLVALEHSPGTLRGPVMAQVVLAVRRVMAQRVALVAHRLMARRAVLGRAGQGEVAARLRVLLGLAVSAMTAHGMRRTAPAVVAVVGAPTRQAWRAAATAVCMAGVAGAAAMPRVLVAMARRASSLSNIPQRQLPVPAPPRSPPSSGLTPAPTRA